MVLKILARILIALSVIFLVLGAVSYFGTPLLLRATNWVLLAILSALFANYLHLERKK